MTTLEYSNRYISIDVHVVTTVEPVSMSSGVLQCPLLPQVTVLYRTSKAKKP